MSEGGNKPRKKDAFAALMGGAKKAVTKVGHKKKNKSLKTYFPPKKNSLGYPMKYCKFQPVEGDYMYQPWWYGQMYDHILDGATEQVDPLYCRHCKLQPCVTVEDHISSHTTGYFCYVKEKKPKQTVRLIIANRLEMHRRRIFDLDYGAPPSHTKCMTEYVNWLLPDKDRDSYWNPEEQDRANGVALPIGIARLPPGNWEGKGDKSPAKKQEEPTTNWHGWHGPEDDVGATNGSVEENKEEAAQKDEEDSAANEIKKGDRDIPLALLRNHEQGDEPLEEKARTYRKIQAKQAATNSALNSHNNNSHGVKGNHQEQSEESSDEEFEF